VAARTFSFLLISFNLITSRLIFFLPCMFFIYFPYIMHSFLFYSLYNILFLSFFFITNTSLCLCSLFHFVSFVFFFDARCASLLMGGGVMAFGHDASFHILPSHILMTGIPESSGFLTHVYMTTWVYIVPRLFSSVCMQLCVCSLVLQ
jgi:hypothetical protein